MSNVPKLRFKGFEEEWKKTLFNSVFKEVKEKTGDLINYPLYSLTIEDGITKKTERYTRDFLVKKKSNYNIVFPNQLVYNPMNITLGAFGLYKGDRPISVSGYYNVFENYSLYNNDFIELYLKTHRLLHVYKTIATGSLIEKQRVHFTEFKKIKEPFPSIEESERIGVFFNLIERAIQNQQEKIELLKEQKKGYMQKIFNRELRLNDGMGRNIPEWEVVKIGDVFSERTEKGNESYELLSVTLEQGVIRRSQIDAKDNSNPNKSKYKVVNKGDIVYNSMRMWQGANGVSSYEGIVSPAYTVLIPSEKIYPLFIGYLFKHDRMIYEFKRYSQGLTSDTWNLKYPQISEIKVKLPCKSEQERIGQFFNLIDRKIKFETKKLNEMIQKKKFFMQNMFL